MNYTDEHIVETYSGLLEGLNAESKTRLVENLSKSIEEEKKDKDSRFYNSFGAFVSEQSPEEIIADIKANRTFRDKEIRF